MEEKQESFYNGVNNNYIPPKVPFADIPEMDCFTVEETEDGPVVVRKKREPSEDLGDVDAYSLKSMLANGVDPSSLNIHTSKVSRLDSSSDLDKYSKAADYLTIDSPDSENIPPQN